MLSIFIYIENDGLIFNSVTGIIIMLGVFYRTLYEGSIISSFFDISICSIFAIALLRFEEMYNSQIRKEMISILLPTAVWLGNDFSMRWLLYYVVIITITVTFKYILHFVKQNYQNKGIFSVAMMILSCCILIKSYINYH
jgi:hypothetical protein